MVFPAVAMRGVDLSLGRGAARVHILRDVALTIGKGEAVGIVGASGSGKSTLLMIMAGLERPDKGEVEIDGVKLGALNEDALGAVSRAAHRHCVPVLSPDPDHDRARKRRGAARACRRKRRERAGEGRTRAGGSRRPPQPLSRAAVGRRAAARGARPRALPAPLAPDRGRADRQSRRGDRARDHRHDVRSAGAARSDAGARHP